jgi:hypothetical protein
MTCPQFRRYSKPQKVGGLDPTLRLATVGLYVKSSNIT